MYQTKQRLNARSVQSKYTERLFLLLSLSEANPLNIDRMRSWSCKQMFYELHMLVPQPSKHYYLLENISPSKFQQSGPFPLPFVNSCYEDLNLHLIYKIFVQDTPLLSSNKNVIMPPAQAPPHMDRERLGCLSLRNI